MSDANIPNLVLNLDDDAIILLDNDTYKAGSLSTIEMNDKTYYVLVTGNKVKRICGDNYKDGDMVVLEKGLRCDIIKEHHDHWCSLAKGIIIHNDNTVNREAMTRTNSLIFRCWHE